MKSGQPMSRISVPRPTICIISFSPIARDARVLRQIQYLVPQYDLIVVGYGAPPDHWKNDTRVRWLSVDPPRGYEMQHPKALLIAGKIWRPSIWYELCYWLQRLHVQAFACLKHLHADLVYANDWQTLPLGWRFAVRWNAPLILDLHEYAPLEWEEQWKWRLFVAPMTNYFLRRYAIHADATLTVAPEIAQRYYNTFGFLPTVVLNAPEYLVVADHAVDPQALRLIHHGSAIRARTLELMIDTIRFCDRRYRLAFMLVDDEGYIQHLRAYADRVAPGRVSFLEPVAPNQITQQIAPYDVGIHLLRPTNYNNSVALPNKMFDFIHAGLAVCVGPSPGMASFVREWQCGVVAPSFDPAVVASTLNRLTVEEIQAMRRAARVAAARINASSEMAKVVEVCSRLLQRA